MRIDTIHKLLKTALSKADKYNITAFEVNDPDNNTKFYNLNRDDFRKACTFILVEDGEFTIRFRNKDGESLGIFNINYTSDTKDPFEIVYDWSNNDFCQDIFDTFEADHLKAEELLGQAMLDISIQLEIDINYVKYLAKR